MRSIHAPFQPICPQSRMGLALWAGQFSGMTQVAPLTPHI